MRADVSVSLWVLCRLLKLYYHVILCFLGKLRIMPRHYMWSSFCFLRLCDFILWAVSCCKKWPTTFLIMSFHITLQHSKSPKCLLFLKKKKKIEWSVQYIEVNCHFFYIPLQVNGFPAENLLYPDRFYSKGMLFLVLGMRAALCGELCNNSSVKITFCVSVSLQAVFRSSKLM